MRPSRRCWHAEPPMASPLAKLYGNPFRINVKDCESRHSASCLFGELADHRAARFPVSVHSARCSHKLKALCDRSGRTHLRLSSMWRHPIYEEAAP